MGSGLKNTANKPFRRVGMKSLCAICCRPLNTENPKVFFCSKCYHDWEKEIKARVEWVRFLISDEAKRRRWDTYVENGKQIVVKFVYIGDEFDIDENGKVFRIGNKHG